MTGVAVQLRAPRYVLGEYDEDHATIPNLAERIAEFRILPKPGFWGWGNIRRTEKGVAAMAVETGTATLRAAGLDPAAVDALVLCSTRLPADTRDHGHFVQTIMTGIGLDNADFTGVTLGRCVNLLAALQVAEAMVAGGRHRRVLVITADRAEENDRVEKFALFSDGAASCLVMDARESGACAGADGEMVFEMAGCAAVHDIHRLDWSNEIDSDLSREVNERVLKPRGLTAEDVAGLCHSNIFRPIVTLKEMQAGFVPAQLYTGNIERIGHCFAADPIINLVDRAAAEPLTPGGHYLLAASVPGSRIGVLLRAVTP
ncbi:beta-ketoacyl-[acyl-carrier-protein] synthase family protein [Actinomadura rudentiformis]|uniref:3-oxoacyl-ACP synthase n=1 Tax=Actinomadura rudentiformis TaxID=359158 RepID=A0A6H9Y8U2_9ACTN|nr:3-oxoacyl-ACP synthase [Actinomadura rudentiformis]KAB2339671.1 3-oxoacyl-ACP synthase [Actinomadura rudentiformis]